MRVQARAAQGLIQVMMPPTGQPNSTVTVQGRTPSQACASTEEQRGVASPTIAVAVLVA